MPLQRLSAEAFFNGRFLDKVNECLDRCVRDCEERPNFGAAREVTVKLTVKPDKVEDGELLYLATAGSTKTSVPAEVVEMTAVHQSEGGYAVNVRQPANPDQGDIEDYAEAQRPENVQELKRGNGE